MVLASWTKITASLCLLSNEAANAFHFQPLRTSPPSLLGVGGPKASKSRLFSVYNQTSLADVVRATEKRVSTTTQKKDVAKDLAKDLFLQHLNENLALSELFHQAAAAENIDDLEEGEEANDEAAVVAVMAGSKAAAETEALLPKDVAEQLGTFHQATTTSAEKSVQEILPASSVVGMTGSSKIEAPSVVRILKFAIPAIGVYLCDPILSLIDTSCVGMLAGTIPQAALTPACAVTDYAALLIAFVFTATTNLVAAAKELDRGVPGSPKMTRNLVGSLQLSTYVGAVLGFVLFVFARPLVQAIVGTASGVSPAVMDSATIYVRIRALGMPAAAQIGSAQAACLGMQDIPSQFIVLAAAALVNLVTDLVLVGQPNVWIGGAAGAAWATVFSQYTAVAVFCHWVCSRKPSPETNKRKTAINVSSSILNIMGNRQAKPSSLQQCPIQSSSRNKAFLKRFSLRSKKVSNDSPTIQPTKENPFSVRGLLAGRVPARDLFKLPSRGTIKEFWPYFLPVTFAQLGRVSGYVAMSYVVASSMGTLAMAAQQIIASLVYCLFPVSDSLSLTGQAFVPPIAERKPSPERSAALRQIMVNLSKAAGIFGVITAALVGFTPLISGFLTSDPLVTNMVNGVVPMLAASFPIYALVMAFEGFLLGQKDLGFQGKMYTSWFFIVPYFMLKVKKAVVDGAHHVGINGVWAVLCCYQVVRFLSWAGRAFLLQKRTERKVEQMHLSSLPV